MIRYWEIEEAKVDSARFFEALAKNFHEATTFFAEGTAISEEVKECYASRQEEGKRLPAAMRILLRRLFTVSLLLGSFSCNVFADSDTNYKRTVIWTKGVGFSCPLVASVSGGILTPILRHSEGSKSQFGSVAVQASVDVGIGGGLVSGGVFVPINNTPISMQAISIKAAVLRTWLLDLGSDRDRTYRGGVVELFSAAAGMGGKIGMGYFQTETRAHSSDDGFVYLYVGMGF